MPSRLPMRRPTCASFPNPGRWRSCSSRDSMCPTPSSADRAPGDRVQQLSFRSMSCWSRSRCSPRASGARTSDGTTTARTLPRGDRRKSPRLTQSFRLKRTRLTICPARASSCRTSWTMHPTGSRVEDRAVQLEVTATVGFAASPWPLQSRLPPRLSCGRLCPGAADRARSRSWRIKRRTRSTQRSRNWMNSPMRWRGWFSGTRSALAYSITGK